MSDYKLFISYSWNDISVVNAIENDLKSLISIDIKRDTRDIKYRDSIKRYMKQIRTTDFVLLVISDSFIKSPNCMFEILELIKDEDFKQKMIPIIVDESKIFSIRGRIEYVKFWQNQSTDIKEKASELDVLNLGDIPKELKVINQITSTIGEFLSTISDLKIISVEDLVSTNYQSVMEVLGIPIAVDVKSIKDEPRYLGSELIEQGFIHVGDINGNPSIMANDKNIKLLSSVLSKIIVITLGAALTSVIISMGFFLLFQEVFNLNGWIGAILIFSVLWSLIYWYYKRNFIDTFKSINNNLDTSI